MRKTRKLKKQGMLMRKSPRLKQKVRKLKRQILRQLKRKKLTENNFTGINKPGRQGLPGLFCKMKREISADEEVRKGFVSTGLTERGAPGWLARGNYEKHYTIFTKKMKKLFFIYGKSI